KTSLLTAYKTLFEQWRIAFEIGALNTRRGAQQTSIGTLIQLLIDYRANSHHTETIDYCTLAGQSIL
ncbi:MAG: hypothetical protein L0220_28900, partial [Acidobacteria bacterium]|nr:hypothetical protein [Acidobacteriota bacterium]